ncbi:MAG: tRNA 2-thiouridine(34) synthase MnmA [Firmicutes bacterium]|nr:tRNA 2-thiouridine(34) synthase MnmA [Bacillota bacterium]
MGSSLRVIVAMSGGVDSSVAAALLLEQGYEVIGVTMQLWDPGLPYGLEPEGGCCSLGAVEDARAVANQLGIPYYVINFRREFRERVVDNFVSEYLRGRTPNPCIVCNHSLKFGRLLEKARGLNADFIATGHYARKERDLVSGRWLLKKGIDTGKDQSYFLYGLTQEQLSRSLFPLGDFTKSIIREKAVKLGLRVASKPESQEICFIPDQDYGRFIDEYRPGAARPGKIRDINGKVLAEHSGIANFTIGQRKGLGIAAGSPLYVTEIRPETHDVIVGSADQVFADRLLASDLNWIAIESPLIKEDRPPTEAPPLTVEAKIRYSAKPALATVKPRSPRQVEVHFQSSQRAITPGQAIVFYHGDLVLGGGTIDQILR